MSQAPTWTGRTIGGRYKIDDLLGRGGMSSVYKAEDPNLQRTVAVKIIHPHLSENPEFVRRFEQEAAAVAKLRHPNIMQVHDFNHEGDTFYIVFEYIPGQPLDQKLQDLRKADLRMPLTDVIEIMMPLCDAVAYAHERGTIHRDLKPSNVIINLLSQPILLDFGIAKIVGDSYVHTATGATMGTAQYMAPEQVLSEKTDHRADIYSLGIMLYEMAAGRAPYEGKSAITVMMKHVNDPVPDVRLFNTNLPSSYNAIMEKALAKNPDDRYNSATELALALRELEQTLVSPAETTQILATPPPPVTESEPEPSEAAPPPTQVEEKQAVPETAVIPPPTAVSPPAETSQKHSKTPLYAVIALIAILLLAAGGYFLYQNFTGGSLPTSENMVFIPEGTYTVGSDNGGANYAPTQQVELAGFWLDRTEVTNAQFAQYIADTGTEPPSHWGNEGPPSDADPNPVHGGSWAVAQDYCQWAGKRLPTEAEWEVAARGSLGLLYPWGNDPNAVSLPTDDTYPVASQPANRSPFGLYDMSNNVWEWVDEPYVDPAPGEQVARGGSYNFFKDLTYRLQGDPTAPSMVNTTGFRCAADEVEEVADPNIILQDDFTDETSGWPVAETDAIKTGYHPPDYYHVQAARFDQIATAFRDSSVSDVSLEANVFVDSTDTPDGNFRYGLAARRNGDSYYAFTVSPRTNTWAIFKSSPDGLETLAEGEITTLQNSADAPDLLRADLSGNTLFFYINGELITQLTDSSYSNGEIGFFVQTLDEERAHVHYDDFLAQKIPALPETAVAQIPPTTVPETAVTPEPTEETAIDIPEPTPEPTAEEATAVPTLTPIIEAPENMALIPAGSFLMGSSDGQPDEQPEHEVTLDAFFLDLYEVSNADYRACMTDGGCNAPVLVRSATRLNYLNSPIFDNYPVIGVRWTHAAAYCEWAGKRLPTEAEWEYAASGPDNFTWPWGNQFDPDLSAATAPDTQPVDEYPDGASPFGIFNMAGNVNEWVQDTYGLTFYANSPAENPVSDAPGNRVYRGGSFDNEDGSFYTTSRRYNKTISYFDVDLGFRCAQDVAGGQ